MVTPTCLPPAGRDKVAAPPVAGRYAGFARTPFAGVPPFASGRAFSTSSGTMPLVWASNPAAATRRTIVNFITGSFSSLTPFAMHAQMRPNNSPRVAPSSLWFCFAAVFQCLSPAYA
jgi:hypothetical protein